jgi:murein L,D-transpeptidase YafK
MRGVRAYAAGLALVGALLFFGIAWPLSEGYPSLLHGLGDRIISDQEPRFDRSRLRAELVAAGFVLGDPAHIRIFKQERRLEVWMQRSGGRYALFKTYPICNYSGDLGPKLSEGDHQAPEGYYRIARSQLNPNSRHHLAFNLGFPNAFDRQLARTGSALMVHGGCSSVGCYAVGDPNVDQIYAIVEAALLGGQEAVDIQALPFVLSDANMAQLEPQPWLDFWKNLKQGFDLFEADRVPPKVGTCNGDYRFGREVGTAGCVEIGYWRA